MNFATHVRTWRVARLYSEIALSRKPFGIEHMYLYTFLLKMAGPVTSQNTDLSSWDILYISKYKKKLYKSEIYYCHHEFSDYDDKNPEIYILLMIFRTCHATHCVVRLSLYV
jgi:hypothetical protein